MVNALDTPLNDPAASEEIKRADRARKIKLPVPTEAQEQAWLFEWAGYAQREYPELKWLFHIPNGSYRPKATAARLRLEGVKPGVPDLFLPVPMGRYNGLFLEMKRKNGGKISGEQNAWLFALDKNGYCVRVCKGWQEATGVIVRYLEGAEP